LIAAEIRRASDKAAWYERRGEPQRAMQYRAYAKPLQAIRQKWLSDGQGSVTYTASANGSTGAWLSILLLEQRTQ
jgi:hypothetical protein